MLSLLNPTCPNMKLKFNFKINYGPDEGAS